VVSGVDEPARIRELIDAAAWGYVPTSSSSEVLIAALKLIMAGSVYLPPAALDLVSNPEHDSIDGMFQQHLLSSRQTAVLLRTLGVHNRTEAVFAAARWGLTPSPFDRS
jgi:DNA-binding NarL/FixJ family response regulator